MEDLFIEGKGFIPKVELNAQTGVLNFSGQSYHEYTDEFFDPIFAWISQYLKEPGKKITVNFRMTYFNTASSKCFLEILEMLKAYQNNCGGQITVNWYYQANDYDMLETGEDFIIDTQLNINLIPY
ncbi:MAG: DUF1987 domain-containing protein [Cytophagales bacterium]|nr:DUF1987 domain-containing protein [Cytophagales bacterium]MDW8383585.1 DUF1987 domain-containing protein [Flammeovirgaceae bacterium]